MALTAEQQAEIQLDIDKQKFRLDAEMAAGIYEKELKRDQARKEGDINGDSKRNRMELVRLAKEVLIENNRSKPVDERDITANDITSFAATLNAYIEGN